MLAAIEAGGTKFVCAVADNDLNIVERVSIETRKPEETLSEVFAFFDQYPITAMGVGSFGPIDTNPTSKTYGFITSTPKLAWQHFDFLGALKQRYAIPYSWHTDVEMAAYGELKKGAAVNKQSCVYLTVGTGIGGGVVTNGQILNSKYHPEIGHIFMKRHPQDTFTGACPYHHDCLEGLACGPAIEKRWQTSAKVLPIEHIGWEIEAYYLAQCIMNLTLSIAPEIIIIGGGVMHKEHLYPLLRSTYSTLMNDYVVAGDVNSYIVPPQLGDNAGIVGCLLSAKEQLALN